MSYAKGMMLCFMENILLQAQLSECLILGVFSVQVESAMLLKSLLALLEYRSKCASRLAN